MSPDLGQCPRLRQESMIHGSSSSPSRSRAFRLPPRREDWPRGVRLSFGLDRWFPSRGHSEPSLGGGRGLAAAGNVDHELERDAGGGRRDRRPGRRAAVGSRHAGPRRALRRRWRPPSIAKLAPAAAHIVVAVPGQSSARITRTTCDPGVPALTGPPAGREPKGPLMRHTAPNACSSAPTPAGSVLGGVRDDRLRCPATGHTAQPWTGAPR